MISHLQLSKIWVWSGSLWLMVNNRLGIKQCDDSKNSKKVYPSFYDFSYMDEYGDILF